MTNRRLGMSIAEAVFCVMLVSVLAMMAIGAVHKISTSSSLIHDRQAAFMVIDNCLERLDKGTPLSLTMAQVAIDSEFNRYKSQFRDTVNATVRHEQDGLVLEIADDSLVYAHVVIPYE